MPFKLVIVVRLSLAFLWIFSGVTSIFLAPETGYRILADAGIAGALADLCLIGGSVLDMTLGAWVLSGWRQQACSAAQIGVILAFTVLLTLIAPAYWLHPFGPVIKNVPILALILVVYVDARSRHGKG